MCFFFSLSRANTHVSLGFIDNLKLLEKSKKLRKLFNHIKNNMRGHYLEAKASIDVRAFHSYVKTKDITIPN